jgi:glycosyltransferase involved in cell wall biosynthesis
MVATTRDEVLNGGVDGADAARRTKVVVDVAVTAYRRADFVRDAIESVLGQSFDGWRLTIFENGPGGGDIEKAVGPYMSDERVSFNPSGRDLSLAENWTRAIGGDSGTYVALLHDDDRWHPGFLQARVDALESHPECGFVFSEWVGIDERGAEYARAPVRFAEGVIERRSLSRALAKANVIGGSTLLVRRTAYEAAGPAFDERWFYCDWEMWARLAARFPAYYLARHDNDFRRHAQANSFVTPEDPDRLLAMMSHIERLFGEHVPGFELSRMERARARSRALIHGAFAVYLGGGWRDAAPLYRRAIREYPPTLFEYTSLSMLGNPLLRTRAARFVARALRASRTRR